MGVIVACKEINSVGMLLGIKFVSPEAVNLFVCYNPDLHSATVAVFTPLIMVSLLLIAFLLSELKAVVIYCSFEAFSYTSGDHFGAI